MTACCQGLSQPPDSAVIARAIAFVTPILFRLSGRQFPGECPRIIRPCFGDGCGCGSGWAQWPMGGWSFGVWDQAAMGWSFPAIPYRQDGNWFNQWSGGCGGTCHLPGVDLPAPIAGVTEVVINGVVLDPSAYKVEGFRRLVRVDGGSFPCTQNRARESAPYGDEPNDGSRDDTWQVTEIYGRGPGEDGKIATAAYACEMAKWLCGGADCNLPERVKSIDREGVSLELLDPAMFIKEGKTGFPLVDTWINSVNPTGAPRRAVFSSLDGTIRRRRGGQGFT